MIGTIAAVATALTLGALALRRKPKRRKKRPMPTPEGPKPTPSGPKPTPTPADDEPFESFHSPYLEMDGVVDESKLDVNAPDPYRVLVNWPGTAVHHGSNLGFATQTDAVSFIRHHAWWYGRPDADDDIFVRSSGQSITDEKPRGSVWQSVTDGTFYFTVVGGGFFESKMRGYPGIDLAEAAMWDEIRNRMANA